MIEIGDRYFDYLFYIDFEASMMEPRAQFALGHLQVDHSSYPFAIYEHENPRFQQY